MEKEKIKEWVHKPLYLVIFSLISSLPLIYMYQLSKLYPWNLLAKGDMAFNLSGVFGPWKFFLGIGPTLILSILGSYQLLRKKDDLSLLLIPWSFAYIFGFFFISKISNYNSQRFLQTPFFIVLGILTTAFIEAFSGWLGKKLFWSRAKIAVILTIFILALSYSAYKFSLRLNKDNFSWAGDYVYFAPKENLDAVRWLAKNTKENDIVLAEKINAELVSALAGNFVFYNIHAMELDNFYDLEGVATQFYQRSWPDKKAEQFVVDQKIRYIFWSGNEKKMAEKEMLVYPFLEKVYENPKVNIYKYRATGNK